MKHFKILRSRDAEALYEQWKVMGQPLPRAEWDQKVTGQAVYPDDVRLPEMMQGRILRSPYAHARIKGLDTRKAEKLIGPKGIVTYRDILEPGFQNSLLPGTPFYTLSDRLFYVGDIVAAVAADDDAIAEEAMDLIEVDYELLPFLLTPEESSEGGAYVIHPEWGATNAVIPAVPIPLEKTEGDMEEGFRDADTIVERHVRVPALKHMFLEQMNCVASWKEGGLYEWVSCQSLDARGVRGRLSTFFCMPMNRIQVYGCYVGGGFGGKQHSYHRLAVITALLARKTGRPVKIRTNIREQLVQGNKHEIGPGTYTIKVGVKKDGTISALRGDVLAGEGMFVTIDIPVGLSFFGDSLYNYHANHRQFSARPFYTNTLESGPLRAYGSQLASFAIETIMDEAIEKIGMDPVTFRIKNGLRAGDTISFGSAVLAGGNMPDLVEKAALQFGWGEKWQGWGKPTRVSGSKRRGVGLAVATHGVGTGSGTFFSDVASVKICEDGTAEVSTGVVDMGSGLESSICQVAAEVLELPYECVRKTTVDTMNNPCSFGSFDSRGLTTTVTATYFAAQEARKKLLTHASRTLGVEVDELAIDGRKRLIYKKDNPDRVVRIEDLIFRLGQIMGVALGTPAGPALAMLDPARGIEPKTGLPFTERGLFATFAEVEVDTETGEIQVTESVVACEAGMVINPKIAFGQCFGGSTFGVSIVLREGYIFDEKTAAPLNTSYTDYPIASALDVDEDTHRILILSDPALAPTVPFHAKGIGEGIFAATLGAVANALYNALGVRIRKFPLRPENVLEALGKAPRTRSKGVV